MARIEDRISTVPVHPFLFAVYPVARLYQENMFEVELLDVVVPLLVVMAATAIGLVLLTLLFHDRRRGAIVTTALVISTLLFGLVAEFAEPTTGDIRGPLIVAVLVLVGLAVAVARRAGSRLGSITTALNLFSFVLVVLAVVPTIQTAAREFGNDPDDLPPAISLGADQGSQRDIYHLILDRYGSEASLKAGFGIDNSEFIAWLRDQGFDVVDDAEANYTKTMLSLSATLGMQSLEDMAKDLGPDSGDLSGVRYRLAHSLAGSFLQERGYEYVHIGSWFDPTRESRIADRSLFPTVAVTFASTMYETTILPTILGDTEAAPDHERRHAQAAEFQLDRLDRVVNRPGPTYVFAHVLLPHPPYVYLEDGTYAPDEATFESQLAYTNRRVREWVGPLLELPEDEQPIIVIQADEGPYPPRWDADKDGFDWANATDDELLTKFGILDAMYLPGAEGEAPLPEGMTAINTYPELFRRYFGSRIADEPDRVLASNESRPFDFVDITSRLKSIEAAKAESAESAG